jgi:hypothetical protein
MNKRLFTKIFFAFTAAGLFLISQSVFAATQNTITITDKSGKGLTNYPLQFGRPFVQGEIVNIPQLLLNGTPIPTQADVKNRYADGTVKYAIISAIVPAVPANGSVILSFKNQTVSNNTPLTKETMLSPQFNFDAAMKLYSGNTTQSASARAMLTNGDYTLWTSGPVAQTILLADDSAERKYDIGFDTYRSIRPRFYATFWPTLNKVTVRFVGENSNVGTLEDVAYSLSLSTGLTNPVTVYTKSDVVHSFLSRWTKTFWIGGAPEEKVNIDNNLPYLIDTKYFPNFDTSVTVPGATIASSYAGWLASKHDLFEGGAWTKYMPTTGGRDDIGLINAWAMRWLYSGDWRARTVALGQADLASAWPLHAREGSSSKKIDKAQTISGLGLPISVYAYPTSWIPDNNGGMGTFILKSPRITTNPKEYPPTGNGWVPDGAHQPDAFYVQYVLTGDYYYLEESQMWASMSALSYCVGATWCRGSAGMAGIEDQVRGDAWVFRNRANAALMTPDNMPVLKNFYTQITNDALAIWEGQMNITGTTLQNTAEWKWGKANGNTGDNPIHFIACQDGGTGDCESAQWQHYYFMTVLGTETERGILSSALSTLVNNVLTSQITAKDYNVYNLANYWIQVKSLTKPAKWLSTWAEIQKQNVANKSMAATGTFATISSGSYYPVLATAAASFMTKEPNGQAAWDFLRTNVKEASLLGKGTIVPGWYKSMYDGTGEIGWNILPRGTTPAPVTPVPSPTPTPVPAPTPTPSPVPTPTSPSTTTPSTPSVPTGPLVSNEPLLWSSTSGAQRATKTDDTITVGAGITKVEGISGLNTVILTTPNNSYAYKSHFAITYNTDGTVGIQDVHSTGFILTVHNIQKVIFPSKEIMYLDGNAVIAAKSKLAGTPTPAPVAQPVSPALLWPQASNVLIATAPDATLTAGEGITKVEGIGGNNTVILTKPNKDANKSWYKVTYNADKSVTVTDVHASGYSVMLYNIQKIVFPSKETLQLSGATSLAKLKASLASVNGVIKNTGTVLANTLINPTPAVAESCVNLTENMHRGNETSAVTQLQTFLINKGLLSEQVSGFFGDLTIAAVKSYQKSAGLPTTGMVYDATREAIMTETCQ